jgi:hypothetical protein
MLPVRALARYSRLPVSIFRVHCTQSGWQLMPPRRAVTQEIGIPIPPGSRFVFQAAGWSPIVHSAVTHCQWPLRDPNHQDFRPKPLKVRPLPPRAPLSLSIEVESGHWGIFVRPLALPHPPPH